MKILKSLYDWCIENNRNDIIDFWDYDMNEVSPKDVGFSSNSQYYFKCKFDHISYLKRLKTIRDGVQKDFDGYYCPICNSIGNYLINLIGEENTNKLWNENNKLDYFSILKNSHKKVTINCLKNDTHPPHDVVVSNLNKTIECPYCCGKEVCETNSLGYVYPISLDKWSDKNGLTPFDYTYKSKQKVYWKCENNIHDDYLREICNESQYEFKCHECIQDKINESNFEDLSGNIYGKLFVLKTFRDDSRSNKIYCKCVCECGNETFVLPSHLKSGNIISCGCYWLNKISGKNNHNWKGGITPLNEKIRQSDEYKDWRNKVLSRDKYKCQCCGSNQYLHAHHIKNFSNNEELRFDINNGLTLCKNCHDVYNGFHHEYGSKNNNENQLNEYIYNKRKSLGVKYIYDTNKYKKFSPFN